MTALDTKALAEQAWRDLEIAADATGALEVARLTLPVEKVRALVAEHRLSPSQGEGPSADVVERLQGWLDGTFAYARYRGMPDGVPQLRDDLRAALASLAPRAAQEAPADEQLGETSRVADDGQPDEAQEWHDYDPDC